MRAIESDVALVISVLRLANGLDSPRRGQVESIVGSVEVLSPEAVQALAANAETFEFFERGKTWDAAPERFRLHAVAVQRAADRLAAASSYPHRDRLLVTALLHDVGKLVLMHAYPGYPRQVHGPARTPEERLHYERRELGVDHALVGGVLARRWNLPKAVASAIERHHAEDAQGDSAFVRLADMLAHYSQGSPVSSTELLKAARAVGFGPSELRAVLYDLPYPSKDRPRSVEPCPLSTRELEVLKRLSAGHGLQADRATSCRSRPARCARTCTTSTASWARSTAPRPCSTPPNAAGSKRGRLRQPAQDRGRRVDGRQPARVLGDLPRGLAV